MSELLVVIGCGSVKQARPAPVREFYQGQPFRAAVRAAEATGRSWVVLSFQHCFLEPDELVWPYDARARQQSPRDARLLAARLRARELPEAVESWAPRTYTEAMRLAGIRIEADPLAGLGIGQRKTWWKELYA